MSERLKRVLLIIGFVLVGFAIAAALYVVFFRAPAEVTTTPGTQPEIPEGVNEGLPSAGVGAPVGVGEEVGGTAALPAAAPIADGGVTKTQAITTGRVIAPTLAADGASMAYYDRTDGRFYKVNAEGDVERLSDKTFPKAETIVWNDAGEKAVIEFPDGGNIVYDFENEKQITFPSHWEDFDFSPSTDEIIAKSIGLDPNNRSLVIASADGSRTLSIAALGDNADKVTVNWSPNNQVVAFSRTGPGVSGAGRQMIIPIGKNRENFPGLTIEGLNFDAQWNPRGDKIVYSSAGAQDEYRPQLWVVDGNPGSLGERRRSLGINTWIDKCTFAGNSTMYCAVPQAMGPNIGLQRAIADNIADGIYRINIETGASERIAIPQTPQSIDALTVSRDGSRLFFTDKATGILQQLQLK